MSNRKKKNNSKGSKPASANKPAASPKATTAPRSSASSQNAQLNANKIPHTINGIDFNDRENFLQWFTESELANKYTFPSSSGPLSVEGASAVTYIIKDSSSQKNYCLKLYTDDIDTNRINAEIESGRDINEMSLKWIRGNTQYNDVNKPYYILYRYIEGETLYDYYLSEQSDVMKHHAIHDCMKDIKNYPHIKHHRTRLRRLKKERRKNIRCLIKDIMPLLNDIEKMHTHRDGGYYHHDIKPENIIRRQLDRPDEVYERMCELHLIDCGEARKLTTNPPAKKVASGQTDCYAPPPGALFTDKNGAQIEIHNKAFDVYSICATLFRLITNEDVPVYDSSRSLRYHKSQLSKKLKKSGGLIFYQRNAIINGLLWHLDPQKQIKSVYDLKAKLIGLFITIWFIALSVAAVLITFGYAVWDITTTNNVLKGFWKDNDLKTAILQSYNRISAADCNTATHIYIDNGKITIYADDNYEPKFEAINIPDKNNLFLISSLDDIEKFFPNLTTLTIYNCQFNTKNFSNRYSALLEMEKLKKVTLCGTNFEDMSLLRNQETIKVNACYDQIELPLSNLDDLTNVRILSLVNLDKTDLNGIERLENLLELKLLYHHTEDPEIYNNIPSTVQKLTLCGLNIEAIKHLPNSEALKTLKIESMDLSGYEKDVVDAVLRQKNIRDLLMPNNIFNSYEEFRRLREKELREISIAGCTDTNGEPIIDLTPFRYCETLTYNGADTISKETAEKLTHITGLDGFPLSAEGIINNKYKTVALIGSELYFADGLNVGNVPDGEYFSDMWTKNFAEFAYYERYDLKDIVTLFPDVEKLIIKDCRITNDQFEYLLNLRNLRQLYLYYNDNYMAELPVLPELSVLAIWNPVWKYDEECMEKLKQYEGLYSLYFYEASLDNNELLIDSILELEELGELRISYCTDDLSGFERLSEHKSLNYLSILGNDITDWSPVDFMEEVDGRPDDWSRKEYSE